jgi:phosphoribosylformimino-5-aminoimidazole carboxamide ribotide isomerase
VVGRALLDHCAGNTLYIADLDALTGRGVQTPLLTELLQALPEVEIWLDAGFASPPEALPFWVRCRKAVSESSPSSRRKR